MCDLRKNRGKHQNIFLIETIDTINQTNLIKQYVVMGSTGNVYTVTIENTPKCTCPDYATRKKRCKHIYFILIKVMKVDDEDQKKYTDKELVEMFNNIPSITNQLIVDDKIKQTYKLNSQSAHQSVTMKTTDDLCPICLDDLNNNEELDYCKYSCGKPIHKICFDMWAKKKNSLCVFCRASWKGKVDGQYVNLLNN